MRIRLAFAAVLTTALSLAVGEPAGAVALKSPDPIESVTATPGARVGEITITWKSRGRHTTGFDIETALTAFSKSPSSSLPWTGRNSRHFATSGSKRSLTLSAGQTATAGVGAGTGQHLFFRVTALNQSKQNTKTRPYGPLLAAMAKPTPPKTVGTNLRVASFNVRSARNYTDLRPWLMRADDVAAEIKKANADVFAVQELSPGRVDGRAGASTKAVSRQTDHLLTVLGKIKASKYKLVRNTSYVKPGAIHGGQGARILYNSSQLSLLTRCANTTGKKVYSTACSFSLPIAAGDGPSVRRSAAYAEFKDKESGKKFLLVCVHLDFRQSLDPVLAAKYNALRGQQMAAVQAKIAKVRTGSEPVIVAGDDNAWQNQQTGDAPHDYLIGQGYYDTAAAQTTLNRDFPTYNGFRPVITPSPQGFGNRLDNILVRGLQGSRRYANITEANDRERPSDHSLIYADLAI